MHVRTHKILTLYKDVWHESFPKAMQKHLECDPVVGSTISHKSDLICVIRWEICQTYKLENMSNFFFFIHGFYFTSSIYHTDEYE